MIDVLTNGYSNSRTGVNGAETQLNKQAISTSTLASFSRARWTETFTPASDRQQTQNPPENPQRGLSRDVAQYGLRI